MSPEAMGTASHAGIFTPKADVWSAGCVLYELFTGHPPFDTWADRDLSSKTQLRKLRQRHVLAVCPSQTSLHTCPDSTCCKVAHTACSGTLLTSCTRASLLIIHALLELVSCAA